MAVFVLGDPHLSFSTPKPMDIFGARWKNHAEKIKENWLNVVGEEDTVVLAGDISWAMALKDAEEDLRFFHQLPGKKIILKGNHDYWWETMAKMNRFLEEHHFEDITFLYNNAYEVDGMVLCGTRGWEVDRFDDQSVKMLSREKQRLDISLSAAPSKGERIVFFHYPPFAGKEDPFLPILKKHGVARVYYGHLHGTAAKQAESVLRNGIEYTLVSADALDFKPLLIRKTEEIQHNCQKKCSFWAKLLSHFGRKC